MAEVVSIQGVNHNPWFYRAFADPDRDQRMQSVIDRFAAYGDQIRAADADVVVIVGTDHMTQFMPNNMPSFLIASQAHIPATFWNETREFGIPQTAYRGDVDLAGSILRGGLDRHFDLSFSHEIRVDHSFHIPLHYLTADLDIPIVPVFTNCMCPPLPPAGRFYDFGVMLREAIEASGTDRRVAVVSSGHISLEIGGPRMFGGQVTPAFDDEVTRLIREGGVDELLEMSRFDRLTEVGNVTHQFLNFLVTLGVAGGRPASEAEILLSRFTSPFYAWEA